MPLKQRGSGVIGFLGCPERSGLVLSESGSHPAGRDSGWRRSAQLVQSLAVSAPDVTLQEMNSALVVHLLAGNDACPEDDPFDISPQGSRDAPQLDFPFPIARQGEPAIR